MSLHKIISGPLNVSLRIVSESKVKFKDAPQTSASENDVIRVAEANPCQLRFSVFGIFSQAIHHSIPNAAAYSPIHSSSGMIRLTRRWHAAIISISSFAFLLLIFRRLNESPYTNPGGLRHNPEFVNKLPTSQPKTFPDFQFKFPPETDEQKDTRLLRQDAVKQTFLRSWKGYKDHAWMKDEVQPLSGESVTTFAGWGATLVDTLDTLWIMDLKDEFREAVAAVAIIDFNSSESEILNVFEMTIRYLGGLLGAYDISDGAYPILLVKATEIGEILYKAFDTPNRMPMTRWHWKESGTPKGSQASDMSLAAELGSLTLEFTRLSQLTGDSKYYDAVYRVMLAFEQSQRGTKLPGLWPTVINARTLNFGAGQFTIAGMTDSLYEYLPKQFMLLGGTAKNYKTMYERALQTMKTAIFFRPLVPPSHDNEDESSDLPTSTKSAQGADILIAGNAHLDQRTHKMVREPQGQHLGCFAGGMVALAAKLFRREAEDMATAERLVRGCIWAYNSQPIGIMPEVFHVMPCENDRDCEWDEKKWHTGVILRQRVDDTHRTDDKDRAQQFIRELRLQPGYTGVGDRRYILRPEAIESVFVLYRLTGDKTLMDAAWRMFERIEAVTSTKIANAAIKDVTVQLEEAEQLDQMESFWLAETLKYFYLIFSEPELCSLDKFVL